MPLEELTALPQTLQLNLRGPTFIRKEGRGRKGKREGEGRGRKGPKGWEGKG